MLCVYGYFMLGIKKNTPQTSVYMPKQKRKNYLNKRQAASTPWQGLAPSPFPSPLSVPATGINHDCLWRCVTCVKGKGRVTALRHVLKLYSIFPQVGSNNFYLVIVETIWAWRPASINSQPQFAGSFVWQLSERWACRGGIQRFDTLENV